MAKFGTFCYGNGTLYGDGQTAVPCRTFTGRYLWILEIAWDGSYSGTNEAEGRLVSPVSWTRGKTAYVNRQGTGLEPIYAGELTLTLENYDGRYDPYNASSVLYGVTPQGLEMRLRACEITAGVPGTPEPVFSGYIKDIQPVSGGAERVTVTCVDEIENIANQDITTPLVFNITADTAIKTVLDACGIDNYTLDNSALPLTLFNLSNANAMQEINELAGAALGEVFVTRDGRVKFYSLTYNSMASHTIGQADVLKEFFISAPWDTKRTHIKIAANRWARTQVKRLWQSPQDIALTAGQTKTFTVEFSGICEPIQLDPNKGDYSLVGQGYGGSGARWINAYISDITSSGCTVTLTNSSSFPTSTYIIIRGREYVQSYPSQQGGYVPWQQWVPTTQKQNSTKVICSAGDDSIPQRKRSYMRMDNRYIQDANFAQLWANTLKTHLENGAKNPVITLQTHPTFAKMFGIELFDKVTFTSAKKGIDNTFYLGQIRGEWLNENGQDVQIEYNLVNHLYANVTTASEGITEVNDEVPEGGGGNQTEDQYGNPVLPPATGGDCPNDAPANGPFNLGGTGIYHAVAGQNVIHAAFPCRVRGAASHENATVILLDDTAETSYDNGATWTPTGVPSATLNLYRGSLLVYSGRMSGKRATLLMAGSPPISDIEVVFDPDENSYFYAPSSDQDDVAYAGEGMTLMSGSTEGTELGTTACGGTGLVDAVYIDIGFTPETGRSFLFCLKGKPAGTVYVQLKTSTNGTSWSDYGSGHGIGYPGDVTIGIDNPPRYVGFVVTYFGPITFGGAWLTGYVATPSGDRITVTNFSIMNVCPVV